MKHKFSISAVLLAAALLLSGCGDMTGSSATGSASSREIFGAESIADAPETGAETTGGAEEGLSGQEFASSAELTEGETAKTADLTLLAVESALCAEYLDQLSYSSSDGVYFWRAVGYLIGLVGEQSDAVTADGETLRVAASDLEIFVTALFGAYDGQYPSTGEEDPLVSSEYEDGEEIYVVTAWDLSAISVTMTEPEDQGDGTWLSVAELSEDGVPAASYTVTLTGGTEGGLFPYSIAGVTAE